MENKTFELLEKMYSEFSKKFEAMDQRFEAMDQRFEAMDQRFDKLENEIRKTNTIIEHEIMPKITVLFDGQKQLTDQLERIEIAVSKHEDFIMRRIK